MTLLATITEQQYSTPELAGLPGGWQRLIGIFMLLALGYCVFWLYRREARVGASRRLRTALGCLRYTVILLLAALWLEPVIATYTIRSITAGVIVLVDASSSMSAADADDPNASRIDQAEHLLTDHDFAWLRRLAANNEPRIYAFGDQTTALELPPAADEALGAAPSTEKAEWAPLAAVQSRSDFGQALTTVLADSGGGPIAGVVVITDGIFNQGMSIREAAALAGRFEAPFYAVGVGDEHEPPNVRITNLAAPATTARGDPFEIQVEFETAGRIDAELRLEIVERSDADESESGRVIATREIAIGGERPAAENFEIESDRAGEFVYEARLATAFGEAVVTDNRRSARVLVVDESLRVLLIAGKPSFDYRYATRLFERDKTVDVSCWQQSADAEAVRDGDTVITELPRRPEELFKYDAVLLFDPDPRDLGSAWAIAVRRLADEFGGGVFLQAGPHFTSRFLRDESLTELIAILPVTPDPDADVRLSEQGAWRARGRLVQASQDAAEHPLLRFHAEPEVNREIWRALPGVWWYLPVLREKPLAAVLLRHGSPAHAARFGAPVLLATQPIGAGRTCFMAYDNTWRWRSAGERYFNQFWIQMVRYLAQPRRTGLSKRGTIVLDRETIRPGDFLKIEARVLDDTFEPWHESEVEGFVELPDGPRRPLRLQAIAGRAGWFAERLPVDWTGSAVIRIPLPGVYRTDAAVETLSKYIQVEASDVELRRLALQKEDLTTLAEQTHGQYMPLAEAGALPDMIPNAGQVRTTRGGDRPLWDKGWVMGLIAALLGLEWGLRRRNHLL